MASTRKTSGQEEAQNTRVLRRPISKPVYSKPTKKKVGKIRRPERPLLKVVTWNMQGGQQDANKAQYLRKYMKDPMVVAIAVQECTDLFGWNTDPNRMEAGWEISHEEYWSPSNANHRCSMAILTRGGLAKHSFQEEIVTQRPVIGVQLAFGWVWCVHAPRNSPGYVSEALNHAKLWSGGKSLVVGDFNIDPFSIVSIDFNAVASGKPTHQKGSEIDFGFVQSGMRGTWRAERADELISDHYAVVFSFYDTGYNTI